MTLDFNIHEIGYVKQGGGSITPSGTKAIDENGVYDVTNYANASVNVQGTEPTLATLTITPSTTTQTIAPAQDTDGYSTITVNGVTASIDADIVSSNIKSGVDILGVQGTVTELVGETKTITANGTYTPAVGNGFTSVSVNVSGTAPTLVTKTITTNGTYAASSDNADGYSSVSVNVAGTTPTGTYTITANGTYDVTNYATADVNVSGGGGSSVGITREVVNGVMSYPQTSFTYTTPSNVTDIGDCGLYYAFTASDNAHYSSGLTEADLSSLTAISGYNALKYAFSYCPNLEFVDFSNLVTISGSYAFASTFSYNTKIENLSFPSLTTISGDTAFSQAFRNSKLKTLSFPSLTTVAYNNAFNNMLNGVKNCTVHFPSAMQSTMRNWSDVTAGFGGTNTTVLFDL